MTDASTDRISLADRWEFALDPDDGGDAECSPPTVLDDGIGLPGTTDEAEKGERTTERTPGHLTRRYRYEGAAWYRTTVEIPDAWADRRVVLRLERTRPVRVWVDGDPAGRGDSLSTPHEYDLSDALDPGEHAVALRIDTGSDPVAFPGVQRSHAATEHTQTNWNGVVGDLELVATDPVWIDDCRVSPEPAAGTARVAVTVGNRTGGVAEGSVELAAESADGTHTVAPETASFRVDGESATVEVEYDLGDPLRWDEFDPDHYELTATLDATAEGAGTTAATGAAYRHATETVFGVRSFERDGTRFAVNGKTTFLRGNVDCCIFPETGYPPTDEAAWREVFETAREYGLNHYRFHSWCPPEAAFRAADDLGIYLQPELPLWNNGGAFEDREAAAFYRAEAERILDEYGNHPSFVMFALGNELAGDFAAMSDLVESLRDRDPRRLYACGSYNGLSDSTLTEADDYWTTASVPPDPTDVDSGREMVRGAAIDDAPPATTTDYREAVEDIPIPVVAHEIGQYQTYPDFAGLERYGGVLAPRNLELKRDHLEAHGLLDRAEAFSDASGRLSVQCYREEVEAALRTPGFGGFQLLQLEDFPGQGTALVGILDAFRESKGLIEPAEWRQFCAESVPLVRMDARTFAADESLAADVQLAHFGPASHESVAAEWTLTTADWAGDSDAVIADGTLPAADVPQGELVDLGAVEVGFGNALENADVDAPVRLTLSVSVAATDAATDYDVWVYPADLPAVDADSESFGGSADAPVTVSRAFDEETRESLESGEDVILVPRHDDVRHSVKSAFAPCFWSYALFKRNAPPGTMGPLCDSDHPLFDDFPTEAHGDWQWWHLLSNARPIVLDDAPDEFEPLISMIDNIERNQRLGLVFETAVGEGSLLVCAADLFAADDDPSVRAFGRSLVEYAASDAFDPDRGVSEEVLEKLLTI
ncbi:sugar-binding domain-containing protein [Halosimplex aquaticum]|uniref:beta-galactosidase n=1 Tax=Halosimplex aquaticum TaxID=3026162 RepID=A0ABD5Y280_9EURY|nr:sugar-binding domain-containing protein [Halosimplex aquaticum]